MKTNPDNREGKRDSSSSLNVVPSNEPIYLPDRRGEGLVPTTSETSIEEIADPVKIEPMADLQIGGVASTEEDIIYSREPEEFDDSEAGDDEDTLVPITQ